MPIAANKQQQQQKKTMRLRDQ